jgi:DNA polymerase III epsilon subunit-like protein
MTYATYVVLDFETTGLNHHEDDVIEIAAVRLDADFNETASFQTFVKLEKQVNVSEFITGLTGITTEMAQRGMHKPIAFSMLRDFIGHSIVVAQWAPFDLAFLKKKMGGFEPTKFICTKSLTSLIAPHESSSLGPTCARLGIDLLDSHRAMADARATAAILKAYAAMGPINPNIIVVSPGRPLRHIPNRTEAILLKGGAVIVDFSNKF